MSLLKSLLMDKKVFDALDEVDKFIADNEVEEGSLASSLIFDKKTFSTKDNVDDYLLSHLFTDAAIEENDKNFIVTLLGREGFIESTIREIPLRDGIVIVVGILRPMTQDNPFFFSMQSEDNIKLNADIPYVIELAKVVKGFHPRYGEIEITKKTLLSFKSNFDKGSVGIDISIDFDHEVREAAGWLKEVFMSVDNKTLLGVVKWTPKGALSLSDKEFRYFSPEYELNFIHPHTTKEHGPTLMGGALTNRPFLKMEAMIGLNNKNENKKGKIDMPTIELSEHNEKVAGFEKIIQTLQLSEAKTINIVTGLKADNVALSDENKVLKESAEKASKAEKHNLLFSEGKINKAQLVALNEGKDLYEVLTMNIKLNTKPDGKVINDGNMGDIQLSDEEAKMAKKCNLTPEEFVKFGGE